MGFGQGDLAPVVSGEPLQAKLDGIVGGQDTVACTRTRGPDRGTYPRETTTRGGDGWVASLW